LYFDCGGATAPNRISKASGFTASQNKLLGYYCSTTDNVQQVWVDGTNFVSDASGHTVSTAGGIALGHDGTSGYDNCRMGEVVIINATVSATNREKLEGYLAQKWGLAANLPAAHPYKSATPVTTGVVATLDGTVSDAEGDTMTTAWSKVDGPAAAVTFANASAVDTTATFTAEGVYTLRLTASTLTGTSYDECIITVGPVKTTPTVNTWPTAAVIVEGQSLTSATLSGGSAPVTGSFSYNSPALIPAVGTYSAAVTFTPTNTAIYNTVSGSVNVTVLTAFNGWAGDGKSFNGDANGDGIADGIAWLLGATTPTQNATGLIPPGSVTSGNLSFNFKCLKGGKRGSAVLKLQYSNDLGAADLWTSHTITVPEANGNVGGVDFTITQDPGNPDLNQVQAAVPASAAAGGGKIFVRLTGDIP
jgi:hypothetical protein